MAAFKTPIQCLLFVICDKRFKEFCKSNNSAGKEEIKTYVLLPTVVTENHPKICQMFQESDVKVLGGQEFPALNLALQNGQVQIVELIIARNNSSKCLRVYAEVGSVGLVNSILGKTVKVTKMKLNLLGLQSAVDETNLKIIDELLSIKADINYRNPRGGTFLHLATCRNDVVLVKVLIEHAANVNAARNDGSTPFHLAVQNGSVAIGKLLLENGAILNAKKHDGSTCLQLATARKHKQMFELLVQNGVSLPTENEECLQLLSLAKSNCPKIVRKILSARNDASNCALLLLAIDKGPCRVVNQLLDCGMDVNMQNSDGKSILQLAVDQASPESVKIIMKHSPNLNDIKNKNILRETVLNDGPTFDRLVKILLKYGLTIDSEDKTNNELFHKAVKKDYAEVVKQLLKCGADVNVEYKNPDVEYKEYIRPLLTAVRYENAEVVQVLLENNAEVNFECEDWYTMPISEAVKMDNVEIVEMLLEHGASVDGHPEVLIKAVERCYFEIVEALLKHGANPNKWDLNHRRAPVPIVCAARDRDLSKIDVLLKYGANINDIDGEGYSPLSYASSYGCLPIIEYLIRNNANLSDRKRLNDTPVIRAAGDFRAVEMLLQYGTPFDYKNVRGCSPLHSAYFKDERRSFQFMLNYGFTNESLLTRTGICRQLSSGPVRWQSVYAYEQFGDLLASHMIKMKAAGVQLDKKNVMPKWHCKKIRKEDFQRNCEDEIVRMKSEFFDDTNISIYDILISDTHRLTCYARNDRIVSIMKDQDFNERFPIYASVVRCQLQKGIFRRNLLEEGAKTLHFVVRNVAKLPDLICRRNTDDIVEKILSYLGNQEIAVFSNAVFPIKV